MIEAMEERARLQLAELTNAKSTALVSETTNSKVVTVRSRQLTSGKHIFGYTYDGIRLERSTLLQLLCMDTDCPLCQQTQANWHRFKGILAPVSRPTPPDYQFKHLSEEVQVAIGSRTVFARPAVFQCITICPTKVHPPATVKKKGWDLFEGNSYIGGGLTLNQMTKMLVPLLPTIEAARSWLHQQSPSAFA